MRMMYPLWQRIGQQVDEEEEEDDDGLVVLLVGEVLLLGGCGSERPPWRTLFVLSMCGAHTKNRDESQSSIPRERDNFSSLNRINTAT